MVHVDRASLCEVNATFRASRSSFAISSIAPCDRHATSAAASCGRSLPLRVPCSTSTNCAISLLSGTVARQGKLKGCTSSGIAGSHGDSAVVTWTLVQQRLMRHADIRTTMNTYGDAVTQDITDAHGKVVRLAIPLNGSAHGSETLEVTEKMVTAEGIESASKRKAT